MRGKENIRTWVKMVNKVKNKFLPIDYQVSLLRKMQNLRQRDTNIVEVVSYDGKLDTNDVLD